MPSKSRLAAVAWLVVAGGLAMPLAALAQQTRQASNAAPTPTGFKVILDDEHVRVFLSTFAPGVVVPMRNYPRRTLYILKGPASLKFTDGDGKTELLTQETGSVRSASPGQQALTNVGTNEAVVLVVVDKRDMPGAK